jgi:Domain of unknown function (DUF4276)
MHVEFLLEEPSAEVLLQTLVPRILGPSSTFVLHPFQGKDDLMRKLPNRLRAYKNWLPQVYGDNWAIVVLRDEDRQDRYVIKQRMELIAEQAGLVTRTAVRKGAQPPFHVVNRIAVEELEAWYFGDIPALRAAYPEIPASLASKEGFRDPDAIGGGTAEALERLLISRFATGLPKSEVARTIAPRLDIERNRSRSFCCFRDAVRELASAPQRNFEEMKL